MLPLTSSRALLRGPPPRHAARLADWAARTVPGLVDHHDVDGSCRKLVAAMGEAGWLKACVPGEQGGLTPALDVRTLCITRATLGYVEGLADFAFAMQGLGTGVVSLFGTPEQKALCCPPVRDGKAIAAFALSEPDAGSDVAAMATSATRLPDGGWRLDGAKTWISKRRHRDRYVVFARTGEAPGPAASPPSSRPPTPTARRPDHRRAHRRHRPAPARDPRLRDCRLPADALIGKAAAASPWPWPISTSSAPPSPPPPSAWATGPSTRRRAGRSRGSCSARRSPTSS